MTQESLSSKNKNCRINGVREESFKKKKELVLRLQYLNLRTHLIELQKLRP